MVSCGGRKVQKAKTYETKTVKTDSTFTNVKSVETLNDVITKLNTTTLNDIMSWSYEAPIGSIQNHAPVWIKAGKDSINVLSLPSGSKLHFTNDKSSKTKDSINVDKSKTEAKDETGVNLRKDETGTKKTKTADIQRESTNWALALVAFLLGWFAIPIIKAIIKFFKS